MYFLFKTLPVAAWYECWSDTREAQARFPQMLQQYEHGRIEVVGRASSVASRLGRNPNRDRVRDSVLRHDDIVKRICSLFWCLFIIVLFRRNSY